MNRPRPYVTMENGSPVLVTAPNKTNRRMLDRPTILRLIAELSDALTQTPTKEDSRG